MRSWSEPGLQVTWRPSASWGSPGGGRPRRLLAPSTAEAGGCGWGDGPGEDGTGDGTVALSLRRGHPSALVSSETGSRGGFGTGRGQRPTPRELPPRVAGRGGDTEDRDGWGCASHHGGHLPPWLR